MRDSNYFPLFGGINTETPAMSLKPGEIIAGVNYVPASEGGYERVAGFEVFDGRTKPSSLQLSDYSYVKEDLYAAMEVARSAITPIPGSGPVRGVWYFKDTAYGFRDNSAGDECIMYKSTASGWVAVSTPTLLPGGRYEFVNANFLALTTTKAFYGCDGKNKAFSFDGTTFTQITTLWTPDTPVHIAEFKKHLFVQFADGEVRFSAIGNPNDWTTLLGAGEFGLSDAGVGMTVISGGALVLFTRNQRSMVQGSSSADFAQTTLSIDSGAIEWTTQTVGIPMFLDDLGITCLQPTNTFGDLKSSTISSKYRTLMDNYKNKVVGSMRVSNKDQYRLFFDGGFAIFVTLKSGKVSGSALVSYGKNFTCCCSSEDSAGNELLFCGDDEGYVYQMDSGNSFNGGSVDAWIRLPYYHYKTPSYRKKFDKIEVELNARESFQLFVLPDFSYGSPDFPAHQERQFNVDGGGGAFDTSYWGHFYWDGQMVNTAFAYIAGIGTNLSVYLRSNNTYEDIHTLQGLVVHFIKLGATR